MTVAPATGVEWRLLPRFLIRGTGFASDLLERLRLPATEQAGLTLASLEATVEARRADFERDLFPVALEREQERGAPVPVFRAWYALNQRVRKRQACPAERCLELTQRWSDVGEWLTGWNIALHALEAARGEMEATLTRELPYVRDQLHALLGDERLQEALLLSNPD